MKKNMLFIGIIALISIFTASAVLAVSDPDPKVLKVALLPDESASTVIKELWGSKELPRGAASVKRLNW